MTFYKINCQFEKLSAIKTLKNVTNKEKCITSRHKVNISYHILPNDTTLNVVWKREKSTERSY
jgi:hypothetical protein